LGILHLLFHIEESHGDDENVTNFVIKIVSELNDDDRILTLPASSNVIFDAFSLTKHKSLQSTRDKTTQTEMRPSNSVTRLTNNFDDCPEDREVRTL
jgi:hypothetical protein